MLGEILVENGLLNSEQLAQAVNEQQQTHEKLGKILVRSGFINDEQLMEALEFSLGIPRVRISQLDINPEIVKMLPTTMLSKHKILPLSVNQGRMTLTCQIRLTIMPSMMCGS
jgi:type IV pilus assembly protein PilB